MLRLHPCGSKRTSVIAGIAAILLTSTAIPAPVYSAEAEMSAKTATPIEHVIIIVGENHTFDNVFGTYLPKAGQKIGNLVQHVPVRP